VVNFILQALFQSAHHLYEKREGFGSIPLTNGSGSGRPKNMLIRIPNTALSLQKSYILAWLLQRRREGEEEELLAEPRQPRRNLQQRLPVDGRGVPGRVSE
jgi:hypothetical protein